MCVLIIIKQRKTQTSDGNVADFSRVEDALSNNGIQQGGQNKGEVNIRCLQKEAEEQMWSLG